MKAIQIFEFGAPSVLKLTENLTIPSPSENEVLIKVEYAGVNPVDTYRRSGKFIALPKLPWTPGSDCSGTISELGTAAAQKFKKGQRVYTTSTITGAYASHTLAVMEHVHLLDDKLTFQQGASLGVPYYTAYSALFQRGYCKKGETILIHGASGGVGIACIQMAKAKGVTVIGTAGTDDGLKMIKQLGADHVFNHRKDNYVAEIKEQFGDKISVIIEMLANKNLTTDCGLIGLRGRIVIVGSRDTIDFDPRVVMMKLLHVQGVALFNNTTEEWQEAEKDIADWIQNGTLNPVVAREYEISNAAQAHEDIINNSGTFGKLLLKL